MSGQLGSAMRPYRTFGSQAQWAPRYWNQQTNPRFNIGASDGIVGDFGPGGNIVDNVSPNSPVQQQVGSQLIAPQARWQQVDVMGNPTHAAGGLPMTAEQIRALANQRNFMEQQPASQQTGVSGYEVSPPAPQQLGNNLQYDAMGNLAHNAGGLPMTAQQLQLLAGQQGSTVPQQFGLGGPGQVATDQWPGYALSAGVGGAPSQPRVQQVDAMGNPARNAGGLPMTAAQLRGLSGGLQQPRQQQTMEYNPWGSAQFAATRPFNQSAGGAK